MQNMAVKKQLESLSDEELLQEYNVLNTTMLHTQLGKIEGCKFLGEWIREKYREFSKVPETPKRINIPRGDPISVSRKKLYFILCKSITPRLSLKKFSEFQGVHYGTLRNWSIDPIVKEATALLRVEFALAYIEELERLCSLGIKNSLINPHGKVSNYSSDEKYKLLLEAKYYDFALLQAILYFLEEKIKTQPDYPLKDKEIDWKFETYFFIKMTSEYDIYNPPKNQKTKKLFEKNIKGEGKLAKILIESLYENLEKEIRSGNTKHALGLIDFLKTAALDRIKYATKLEISVLNKGKRQKSTAV